MVIEFYMEAASIGKDIVFYWVSSMWGYPAMKVAHILIECNHLTPTRNQFYRSHSMQNLFATTDPSVIFSFLETIKVYNKL